MHAVTPPHGCTPSTFPQRLTRSLCNLVISTYYEKESLNYHA